MVRAAFSLALLFLVSVATADELSDAKAAYSKADKALNEAYQKAKSTLDEWRFSTVQQEQRDWITYRDDRSLAAAQLDGGAEEGTEESNPEFWKAMTYLTETRTEILEAWTRIDEFAGEWEGVWSDGYGGELIIVQNGDDTVTFVIDVVRGPTYHLGALGGIAYTNGTTARFAVTPDGANEETWLTFLRENGRLRIIGENTHYFHGARAYFDGEYLRVREVTEEDREKVENPEF